MSTVIRFREVRVSRPGQGSSEPLALEVAAGELVVLRTTRWLADQALRLCTGLLVPPRGRVEVLGQVPGELPRRASGRFRQRLGVALLPDGLVSNLSLRMNLMLPLLYAGTHDEREAQRRADALLAELGLSAWAAERPAEVPQDVRQVASVARAVGRTPELLLLEEPFAVLSTEQALSLLALCRREATTVFLATAQQDGAVLRAADGAAIWRMQTPAPSAL